MKERLHSSFRWKDVLVHGRRVLPSTTVLDCHIVFTSCLARESKFHSNVENAKASTEVDHLFSDAVKEWWKLDPRVDKADEKAYQAIKKARLAFIRPLKWLYVRLRIQVLLICGRSWSATYPSETDV